MVIAYKSLSLLVNSIIEVLIFRQMQIFNRCKQDVFSCIFQFDRFLSAKGVHPEHGGKSFCLITDGPNHLRQVLYPETSTKNIHLPSYFSTYYDIRKEFRKFYKAENIIGIKTMLDCILSFKSFMKFSVNFCVIRDGLKVSALYLHTRHSA